ncbi:MAG: DUF1592 domain-containing protein [Planctomycetota bacterium]|nr:DUF1592 domain-containing protein [Planctomycetota bacterium]
MSNPRWPINARMEALSSYAPSRMKPIMNSAVYRYVLILFAAAISSVVVAAENFRLLQTSIQQHCLNCHGIDGEGDVNLLALRNASDAQAQPTLINDLIAVLRDRRMPPETEPPLTDPVRQKLITILQSIQADVLHNYPFEPIPIRRMNRFQYNNAVVDLLGLDRDIFQLNERLLRRREDYFKPETKKMPDQVRISSRPLSKDIDNERPEGFRGVAPFPQDKRAEHGFDNQSDHLTLSPLLMESFLQLSRTVSESPDLNPQECRQWNHLLASPPPEADQAAVLRSRLKQFLRRAFRRQIDPQTLDQFVGLTKNQLQAGQTFEQSMRLAIGIIIGMPDFLYLYEENIANKTDNQTNGRQPINDFELATRLAQFFWSSIPDDSLLDLAEANQLSQPKVLRTQIERMMNDRRSARFCDNFPSQWLQLDRLITSIPDPEKFPYFYYHGYRTSMHMISEPLLLFETIFVEDRTIMDLLNPSYTWQSDMLKANYEGHSNAGKDVQVQVFRRIALNDPRRGGVITNAAVMTMTSTPSRTQPITRGAWVNEVIFNDPPEPPPADIPPLPESNTKEIAELTIRERLAIHRQRADCAGCHNQIDPLGFALENYGPTGVWRNQYENERNVDPSGTLFNQYRFETAIEFKQLLVREKPRFIRAFVAHLLTYALGRELGPADWPTLDSITNKALAGEDTMRTIMMNVALSESFMHKNAQDL